jgi:hypothetical protein
MYQNPVQRSPHFLWLLSPVWLPSPHESHDYREHLRVDVLPAGHSEAVKLNSISRQATIYALELVCYLDGKQKYPSIWASRYQCASSKSNFEATKIISVARTYISVSMSYSTGTQEW